MFSPGTQKWESQPGRSWRIFTATHGCASIQTLAVFFFPFIDIDGDGAADVDENGAPISSNGSIIDLAVIADGDQRDDQGRAIDATGQLIYEYYDAKRSGLAMVLVLLKEALEDSMHKDIAAVVENTIPIIEVCDDGTSTCRKYPSDDNPFADIAWTIVEVSRFEDAAIFLRTWSSLIKDNPQLAEDILVALGQVIEAVEAGSIDMTDPKIPALLLKALPLMDEVFETDNSSGQSTAQLLLELMHDLGATARTFPRKSWTPSITVSWLKLQAAPMQNPTTNCPPPWITASHAITKLEGTGRITEVALKKALNC